MIAHLSVCLIKLHYVVLFFVFTRIKSLFLRLKYI